MTIKEALKLMDEMERTIEQTDPIPDSLWDEYHTLVQSIIQCVLPTASEKGFFSCDGGAYQIYMDLVYSMPPRPYYPKISPSKEIKGGK